MKRKNKFISQYTKELLENIVNNSFSYKEVLRKIGLQDQNGYNCRGIKKIILKYNISVNHFCCNYIFNSSSIENRFWHNVDKKNHDECWFWKGGTYSNGYGRISYNNKQVGAHRISYLIHNGSLDENLLVLHKCNNRLCVNPNHLYQGTYHDNMMDMVRSGRGTQWSKEAQKKRSKSLKRGI
jgi:hypothetical protein